MAVAAITLADGKAAQSASWAQYCTTNPLWVALCVATMPTIPVDGAISNTVRSQLLGIQSPQRIQLASLSAGITWATAGIYYGALFFAASSGGNPLYAAAFTEPLVVEAGGSRTITTSLV